MLSWIKKHKMYTSAIILFVLSVVLNAPETENGLSMLVFIGSLFCGFVGFVHSCEDDSKSYFGDE